MIPMQFLDEKYKNARDVGYTLCTTIIWLLVTIPFSHVFRKQYCCGTSMPPFVLMLHSTCILSYRIITINRHNQKSSSSIAHCIRIYCNSLKSLLNYDTRMSISIELDPLCFSVLHLQFSYLFLLQK